MFKTQRRKEEQAIDKAEQKRYWEELRKKYLEKIQSNFSAGIQLGQRFFALPFDEDCGGGTYPPHFFVNEVSRLCSEEERVADLSFYGRYFPVGEYSAFGALISLR